jgi:hypothetical protein
MVDSNPWSWDVVVVVAVIVFILVEMVNVSAFIIAEVDDINIRTNMDTQI